MIFKLIASSFLISFCFVSLTNQAKPSSEPSSDDIFQNSSESCEAIFNETATLVKPVLLIGSKSFPLTVSEIDSHCKLGSDVYKRVRKYGKCLQGLARQALLIYLHGLKKFLRGTCNSTKKKQATIDDLRCASNETLDGWNSCLDAVNRQLDFVASNSTSVQVVGDVCCIYSLAMTCLDVKTSTTPGCSATANTTKFFKTSIELILKEVMELICSKYTTEAECISNNKGLNKVKAAGTASTRVEGAYLISPLIKIVSKLSDDTDA